MIVGEVASMAQSLDVTQLLLWHGLASSIRTFVGRFLP